MKPGLLIVIGASIVALVVLLLGKRLGKSERFMRAVPAPPQQNTLVLAKQNAQRMRSVYATGYEFPQWAIDRYDSLALNDSVVFYHSDDKYGDVVKMATQREPVNIGMSRLYDAQKLKKFFGYTVGAYALSTPQKLMPNIAIYCKTDVRDGDVLQAKNVHVINLVGYAFDSPAQPDHKYFCNSKSSNTINTPKCNSLDVTALVAAYTRMWRLAFAAARAKGLATLCVYSVGGGAFSPWGDSDKGIATFHQQIQSKALPAAAAQFPDITVRECGGVRIPKGLKNESPQTIATTLYVNAWDPWSMVGNGNNRDISLDGFWGRSTAMAVLCWPLSNPLIKYSAVE